MQQELWGDYVESIGADRILEDHEKRILKLEQSYGEVKQEMTELKMEMTIVHNAQLRMENTLIEEMRSTKELLNTMIKQKFGLDKINAINKWKFFIAVVGSSGLIYLIIDLIRSAYFK